MPQPNRDSLLDAAQNEIVGTFGWREKWEGLLAGLSVETAAGEYMDRLGYLFTVPRPVVQRGHSPYETMTLCDFAYRLMLQNAARLWDIRGGPTAFKETLAPHCLATPIIEEAPAWCWIVGECYVGTAPQTQVSGPHNFTAWLFNVRDDTRGYAIILTGGLRESLIPLHTQSGYGTVGAAYDLYGPGGGLNGIGAAYNGTQYIADWEIVMVDGVGNLGQNVTYTSPVIDIVDTTADNEWFIDWVSLARFDVDVTITAEIRCGTVQTPDGTWTGWTACVLDGEPPKNGAIWYQFYQLRLTIKLEKKVLSIADVRALTGWALLYCSLKRLPAELAAYLRP
ncbi:MAG: hypothetical protein KAW17_09690 [Candidatus Eisenbacteria sp.]|nr:hypothetical protein [Candidatus Eisenbacteria bacterium]